jgi:hypothetical protein
MLRNAGSRCSGGLRPFAINVQVVLLNVSNHRFGDEITDAHVFSKEGPDLGAADVVLYSLRVHVSTMRIVRAAGTVPGV